MTSNKLQKTFGEQVKCRRISLGMTQADLAEKAGIHRPDLSDLENGRHSPTLETVEKIAKALGVPPKCLVSEN